MPAVIFITAFDEFALKAFEANAIDYLLKPVAEDRFEKAVQKFLDKVTPAETQYKFSFGEDGANASAK
jgi:two-component system LytT family response regulator